MAVSTTALISTMASAYFAPCRSSLRNSLAHSVSQRATRNRNHMNNLNTPMNHSDTVCTRAQLTSPCPHIVSNQPGRADMMARYTRRGLVWHKL